MRRLTQDRPNHVEHHLDQAQRLDLTTRSWCIGGVDLIGALWSEFVPLFMQCQISIECNSLSDVIISKTKK